jgi:hypothetical protein
MNVWQQKIKYIICGKWWNLTHYSMWHFKKSSFTIHIICHKNWYALNVGVQNFTWNCDVVKKRISQNLRVYHQCLLVNASREIKKGKSCENYISFLIRACFQKSAYYAGIKIFNSLPANVTTLINIQVQFKVALKRYLNTHSFYSVEEFMLLSNLKCM